MLLTGHWKTCPLIINVKPNCLTLSLEEKGGTQVFSFDNAGRLWTAMLDGISYRRGLDGKIVAKWSKNTDRHRRWLAETESAVLETRIQQEVVDLTTAIQARELILNAPIPSPAITVLERAARFDQVHYRKDEAHYHQVYQPVGILPPDQYMAVVLQATEGCSFNTCTFCNFYRDRPFRIKSLADFKAHALAVKEFLSEGLSLRRTVFLGDANALVMPMSRLAPMLEIVHAVFDVDCLGGTFAFLDGFSGEKKTAQDYATLAALGLKRIYIGMESGNAPLLQFLHKPGRPEDVISAVQAIKAGGIAVGLIVLLGAGGKIYASDHVRDTITALNAMPLDLDDLVYFSELVESEGLAYTTDAYQHGLQPLTSEERIAQGNEIEAGLVFSPLGGTPHISRYDIREFVY
jgi:radical SAM superfamily enzyme YgiQ (UPF0313 family)